MTTTEKRDEAERIAQALVEARLAACVQILGPMASLYRWQGKIEQAQEWLCLVKDPGGSLRGGGRGDPGPPLLRDPGDRQPPILAGSRAYLDWLEENLTTTCEA
jgi:periplasmic divalent cation tolerance protein